MKLAARASRGGCRWLGRNRGNLHRVAWLTILAMILATCSGHGTGSGGWTFRYPPENVVSFAVFLLLLLACAGSLAVMAAERRPVGLPALIFSAVLLYVSLPPRTPFRDGAVSHVCGEQVGCFFLTIAFVPTDTVYDLWHAPERESWIRYKSDASQNLSYSEDGSYVSDPRLILSRSERYLVVARGGYLVDAIEISSGRRVSDTVLWNEADRDSRMQRNSYAIQRLLDADA